MFNYLKCGESEDVGLLLKKEIPYFRLEMTPLNNVIERAKCMNTIIRYVNEY